MQSRLSSTYVHAGRKGTSGCFLVDELNRSEASPQNETTLALVLRAHSSGFIDPERPSVLVDPRRTLRPHRPDEL